MARTLSYTVLDVFAERGFEGNQLAVIHDARGLSDEQMQALAREMNLSETTFVFPADDETERREGVRVRIFTTEEELPFAGHPTLGTATWLYLRHPLLRGAEMITLHENCGPIRVRFEAPDGRAGVRAAMQQNDPVFGAVHERAAVAKALGLREADLAEGYAPQTVSTGVPFCVVMLRSMEVLSRLQIPRGEEQEFLASQGTQFFYCIAQKDEVSAGEPGWRARMQFYSGEDPATGSAAGCCISWLVKNGLVRSGESVVMEQGVEIRRPSRITMQARLEGERVSEVYVSGRTIPVAEGRFFLP